MVLICLILIISRMLALKGSRVCSMTLFHIYYYGICPILLATLYCGAALYAVRESSPVWTRLLGVTASEYAMTVAWFLSYTLFAVMTLFTLRLMGVWTMLCDFYAVLEEGMGKIIAALLSLFIFIALFPVFFSFIGIMILFCDFN